MTDTPVQSNSWRPADVLALFARCLLGVVFVYLGFNKTLHPFEFLKLVRQYDVLHHHLALNFVVATLPWFEIFCGLLLLLGVAPQGAAVLLLAMLLPFTGLILRRALEVGEAGGLSLCAVRLDCGCGSGEVLVCRKLVENLILMGLAGWLTLRARHRFSLRPALLKTNWS
jgi:uncharacterized membrane protein YphA (DoxX/SURF4 family)